jgi:Flp pilus assembly protein TadD
MTMPHALRRLAVATMTLSAAMAFASIAHAACDFGEPAQRPARARADQRVLDTLMGEAAQALARGAYGDACVKYRLVLSVDRDNAGARLGLGEGALGEADYRAARAHFEFVANAHSENAVARQGLGLAQLASAETEAAESSLRRAVEVDPTLWRAWNGLGVIADSRGDWSAADAAWTAALQAAPNEARLHNNRGMSLMQRGAAAEAVGAFDRALRLDPALETAAHNRRIALAMTGQYDAALVGVSDRDLPTVLNNVAVVAARRGDRAVANRLLAAAVTAAPRYYELAERNRDALQQSASQHP